MPIPLSSQTNSSGSRTPEWSYQAAVLNAAWATAWLTDASPKEQTTTASAGHTGSAAWAARPGRVGAGRVGAGCGGAGGCGWPGAFARPQARGRWAAVVVGTGR